MNRPPKPTDCGGPRSHSEKRRSIVETAADVFCREGYAGASLDMVAAEAGVSRQTVYNHHGDKEKLFQAVVAMVTERINLETFATLATFPDKPQNLPEDLTEFAVRMAKGCMCSGDSRFLRKLILIEGQRYPELFDAWRKEGPRHTDAALAARFARLTLAGYLDLADPDLAARQFMALVFADLQMTLSLGGKLSEAEVRRSAEEAVNTFLRAFGKTRDVWKGH